MSSVRSVERAVSILFLVSQSDEAMSLTEVARSAGLDKATALRLLQTLENSRLIQRDPDTRRFGLGPGVWQLINSVESDLKSISRPFLELLRRTTKETVTLVCARGLERIVVDVLPAPHALSVVSMMGMIQPVYAGASGKVFMAYMDEEERDRIIRLTNLKPVNPAGATDRDHFLGLLEDIRKKGYAYSIGDVTVGASALAAPIFDADGVATAAVVLRGPGVRMPVERMEQLAPLVIRTAAEISKELGFKAGLRESA